MFEIRLCLRVGLLVVLLPRLASVLGADAPTMGTRAIDVELVSSFERDGDLRKIAITSGKATLSRRHVIEGQSSLRIDFPAAPASWPNVALRLSEGLVPADWSDYEGLAFDACAPDFEGACAIRIKVDTSSLGRREYLYPVQLNSHTMLPISIFFDGGPRGPEAEALKLLRGIKGMPRARILWKHRLSDRRRVMLFQLYLSRPNQPCTMFLDNIRLVRRFEAHAPASGIVDEFGQCAVVDWVGKIHGQAQLLEADKKEAELLANAPAMKDRGRFGGLIDPRQKRPATGFFRLAQIEGTWWLIDPEGNLFFLAALCNVTPWCSPTRAKGRECLFQWLPTAGDPLAAAFGLEVFGGKRGGVMNFDTANLIRKYGPAWKEKFRRRAVSRLTAWGFTGVHNWQARWKGPRDKWPSVPYTLTWGIRRSVRKTPVIQKGIAPGYGMPETCAS